MSKVHFFVAFVIFLSACSDKVETNGKAEQDQLSTDLINNTHSISDSANLGYLVFTDSVHDFGKLEDGEMVQYKFQYKNEGPKEVLITSAKGSCGCTVPTFERAPIASGAKGSMTVTFDSKGRKGYNEKKVTVITNGNPSKHTLKILSEVH